ncbi:hypothetical protein V2W30_18650 [Streptomyces sp. Q6]|uniref:Uncharacterized protein n=1 Tax=Streptomyces citrinus TaxID=3118173 RepID=A0ACD5AH20_9ACTN
MTYALPALRPRRLTGLTWTVFRLHRLTLWTWTGVVLATTGLLLWLYGPGADAAARELARCTGTCEPTNGAYDTYEALYGLTTAVISATPYLAAIFIGGLCTGRQLEQGTAQLTWVQSVSPTRWLATTLAVPAAWFLTGLVPLVVLHRLVWSSGPLPAADHAWHDPDVFAFTGPLPFARVLLGLGAGALAGVLYRKTAAAALAGIPVLLVVGTLGMRYRPSLWPTVTDTGRKALNPPADADVLVHGAVLRGTGERLTNDNACVGTDSAADLHRCTQKFQDFWVTYHPKSHYWPLQLAETSVVLILAALATAVAFRLLKRRTA